MSEQEVYGIHAVHALLKRQNRVTHQIFVNDDRCTKRIDEILAMAVAAKIPVQHLPMQKMDKRFAQYNHQGIVALASALPEYTEYDLEKILSVDKPRTQPWFVLILDGVTDPHNLGACLRSADAAGVDFVMIPKDQNAKVTPVVSKVASGAAESVPLVRVTNLVRAMSLLKQHGIWIYGAAGDASESLYALDARVSLALVMGAEGDGLRRLTKETCDGLFSLPMLGSVSSLNVSVAAGVSLYEVVRQRHL